MAKNTSRTQQYMEPGGGRGYGGGGGGRTTARNVVRAVKDKPSANQTKTQSMTRKQKVYRRDMAVMGAGAAGTGAITGSVYEANKPKKTAKKKNTPKKSMTNTTYKGRVVSTTKLGKKK